MPPWPRRTDADRRGISALPRPGNTQIQRISGHRQLSRARLDGPGQDGSTLELRHPPERINLVFGPQPVDRALALLDAVADAPRPLSAKTLARRVG
ncbi:helix-turn-helix domain-containing protein [Streptomyces anulatus]